VTHVSDLFDPKLLTEMLEGGFVRAGVHPTLPMTILNYTEKAQYERVWNPVTLTCRGLIVNHTTKDVVARPFRKFFNYGEPAADGLDTSGPVCVTDKMDGSLGILSDGQPGDPGWYWLSASKSEAP
jgi:RNA ligase